MINFDDVTGKNKIKHNLNWPDIPDHLCRARKTNELLNLINHQSDIDKICLYIRDPFETKYQLTYQLINKHVQLYQKCRLKAL